MRAQRAPFFIKGDRSAGEHCPSGRKVDLPRLAVGSVSDKDTFAGRGLHFGAALRWDVDIGGAAKHAEVIEVWPFASDGLKRGNGSAGAARGAVEDMDSRGHGKFPVPNSKLSM